jgi:two-component system chemotaxis response regulator CheY
MQGWKRPGAARLMESHMKRCLVIDDSRIIRKVTRKILEGLNFSVEEAEDTAGALEICRREMPEAVLLDANIPGMSSVEFLRSLRSEKNGTKPTIVLATVENNLSQITEAVTAGANEYVLKPFDSDVIAQKFADVGLV